MSKKQSSRRKGQQRLFYTEAFKQKIVNEVLSGNLNKRQASLIYGIKAMQLSFTGLTNAVASGA